MLEKPGHVSWKARTLVRQSRPVNVSAAAQTEFRAHTIFIDLGAYDGGSTARYVACGGKVAHAFLFEPNADIVRQHPECLHTHVAAAAWNADGEYPFYLARKSQQGSSLLADKTTGDLDRDGPRQVRCVRLARWLMSFRNQPVALKLNIEGAEYAVLTDMASYQCPSGKLDALTIPYAVYLSLHGEKVGKSATDDDAIRKLVTARGFARVASPTFPTFETYLRQGV